METDDLKQFGINMTHKKKPVSQYYVKLEDYHNDDRVKFFRFRLNSRIRVHVAFMDFYNWVDYSYDKINYSIKNIENGYSRYCIGYSMEKIGNKMNSKLLHKKIAIDRLIYRPNIVSVPSLDKKKIYDVRMWIISHLRYLTTDGVSRINNLIDENQKLKIEYKYDEDDDKFGMYYPTTEMSLFELIHAFLSEMYNYQ